jgi:hypothetical protein
MQMSSQEFGECLYSNDKTVVDLALQYISECTISKDAKVLQEFVSLAQPHANRIDKLLSQPNGSTAKKIEQLQKDLMIGAQSTSQEKEKLASAEQNLDRTLGMFLEQESNHPNLSPMITPQDLNDAIEATNLSVAGQASLASLTKYQLLESGLDTKRITQAALMLDIKDIDGSYPQRELPKDIKIEDAFTATRILEGVSR